MFTNNSSKVFMSILQHRIPFLPNRPRVHPIAGKIHRSYPFGLHNYTRICSGQILTLTLTFDMNAYFHGTIHANLVSNLHAPSSDGKIPSTIPFTRIDSRTLECRIKVEQPGLHSFRAEFSFDHGNTWTRDSVPDSWIFVDPPQVDGVRMYTLIPNVSGTISDWIKELERIKSMGFNAVHLLPLTTLDISESPYSAKDLFNMDPRYLDPGQEQNGLAQLEKFVESAKKLGIKLCFDLVLNHVGIASNIAKQAPDWIVPDPCQEDGFQRAKYLTDTGWFYWGDLILIHYDHPSESIRQEIWSYMTGYALFWAKYASATGGFVRFDNLHSSNHAFIRSLTKTLHQTYPDVAILAEYFTDENTLLNTGLQWGLNLNLATQWDYKFVPKLREYLKNIHRLSGQLRFFMPVTSHDSGSPAQEFGNAKSTIPRYVAAALLGTGATGIVQGVEAGVKKKIEFIGKKPKLQIPSEPEFASFLRKVNSILAENPAFRLSGNCRFADKEHPAIIAAFRYENAKETIGFLVVCNFDISSSQRIRIDLEPYLGTCESVSCRELLKNEMLTIPSPMLDLNMEPCSAKVFEFK